jgi:hypothetical protein
MATLHLLFTTTCDETRGAWGHEFTAVQSPVIHYNVVPVMTLGESQDMHAAREAILHRFTVMKDAAQQVCTSSCGTHDLRRSETNKLAVATSMLTTVGTNETTPNTAASSNVQQ